MAGSVLVMVPDSSACTATRALEDPETGPALISLFRSLTTHPPVAEAFFAFLRGNVLSIPQQESAPRERLRLTLMGSRLNGFLTARYILQAPGLAELSAVEAATLIVPVLRCSLCAELPGAVEGSA